MVLRAAAGLLLLLALAPLARGAAETPGYVEEFSGELDAYARTLEALPAPAAECRGAYARLDGREPLTIGVFFGYLDTGRKNYVGDRDFKQALLRALTAPCRGRLRACGFSAAADDPALPNRARLIKRAGGRETALEVFDSAVSGDRAATLGPLAAEQEARSRLAEEEYLAALKNDAAVLYAGHTRRFSDAGLYPPLGFTGISARTLARRPFFSRVYDALRAGASPAVLGLFACHSREYYAGRLHALSPGTALIVSSDSTGHENALLSLYGALDALLARPCYREAARSVDADGTGVFHAYGLFEGAPHPRYTRYLDGRLVVVLLALIPFLVLALSGRRGPSAAAWPPPSPLGAWRGAAFLTLSLVPCALLVRAAGAGATPQLPLLLLFAGLLWLAVAAARGRVTREGLGALAGQAWPCLLPFALLYFCVGAVREASLDNLLSSARQAAAFAALFFVVWPFTLFSEETLLVPFLGEGAPGFVPACLHTLLFYGALWLALCGLAPVYKARLWPLALAAVYLRAVSFLLYGRRRSLLVPAIAEAMTLALVLAEGLHVLIYL